MSFGKKDARDRRDKPRRKMTPERLRNIAVYYCQRYLVSEAKLRDYLSTRLYREIQDAEERAAMAEHIPEIAARLAEAGLVNDREAASSKLRSALRAGYATGAAINNAARSSHVDKQTVEAQLATALTEALPEMEDEDLDPVEEGTMMAGLALKRARRGPYRTNGGDEKTEKRDINWLLRRGFRFDDIRKAMNVEIDDYE
jgi:SOS response regulatory protein OraA/RecX